MTTLEKEISGITDEQLKVIQDFTSEFDSILFKIWDNSAIEKDYKKLEQMLSLIGISPYILQESLKKNNFNDWYDYCLKRKSNKGSQENMEFIHIQAVLGSIQGVSGAVHDLLSRFLKK